MDFHLTQASFSLISGTPHTLVGVTFYCPLLSEYDWHVDIGMDIVIVKKKCQKGFVWLEYVWMFYKCLSENLTCQSVLSNIYISKKLYKNRFIEFIPYLFSF